MRLTHFSFSSAPIDAAVNQVLSDTRVVGAGLCGSYRLGNADDLSDIDLWVFLDPSVPVTGQLVMDELIPSGFHIENLTEGRDDTVVPFIVVNQLIDGRILNFKFITLTLLQWFQQQPASLDNLYLDDLENFLNMKLVTGDESLLAFEIERLRDIYRESVGPSLYSQMIVRHSSYYWRSAFQGVFRAEYLPWHTLVTEMTITLTRLHYLTRSELPPPLKWLFSERTLVAMGPAGAVISELVRKTSVALLTASLDDVLRIYALIAELEELSLDSDRLPFGTWWRHVFVDRSENIRIDDETMTKINAHLGHILPLPSDTPSAAHGGLG